MDSHVPCRTGEGSTGSMVGVADHLRRDGTVGSYVIRGEASRAQIYADMERLGHMFDRHFSGRGVGFEGMMQRQGELWRHSGRGGAHHYPQCWDASIDYSSAQHVDRDGDRSFARWFARHGHASRSRRWWLLFPQHGVVVELVHGVWVSWDGRIAAHCTAVPDVAEGDALLSVFCSLPASLVRHLERGVECRGELGKRSEVGAEGGGGRTLFERLVVGMRVSYRFVPPAPPEVEARGKPALRAWGKAHVRWVRAKVKAKSRTHVVLQDLSSGRCSEPFGVSQVSNRVVIL